MRRHLPLLLAVALGAAACKDDPTGIPQRNLRLGQQLTLNVSAGGAGSTKDVCERVDNREVRVVALSEHAAVLEQVGNPTGGFTDTEYQAFLDEFERVIWPSNTENFGEPSDIDRNGRVMIVFTRAVNELTSVGSGSVVGGFFFSRDLFPRKDTGRLEGCEASNQGEVFFLLAPDPQGQVNTNVRSKDYVRNSSFSTLAHELQHLINSSRRLFVNNSAEFEEVWLDEGLAHIAEELSFYRASSPALRPRQNIAFTTQFFQSQGSPNIVAFSRYQTQNFGRLTEYYRSVDDQSPIELDDDLATRGAAWQFLRYAADQRAGDEQAFWRALVNSKEKGLTNLAAALGTDPTPVFQNWGVSVYTDDAVAAAPQQPSWNYRQVLTALNSGFPLRVVTLTNGSRDAVLQAHGQAYFRFAVPAGGRAEIRTAARGTTVTGACTDVTLTAAGQTFSGTVANASVLCVNGGATGADFVYIPFFGSKTNSAEAPITVTAQGVVSPQGPFLQDAPTAGPTLRAAAELPAAPDAWESRLRARERELAVQLGAFRPSRTVQADPAAPEVRMTVVRTR
jgi:hypothetical protein